ncbi:MAG: valine--tRNA ligase [Cyclobacteriaceae bacterium]|nr:valine--tRNA ligase [Cyclobacteriaceae bacterium]
MSLSTKYNPAEVEEKWYTYWMENGFFHSEPNAEKEPFTIVIPPPNVTGVLHMGHMLNNTIQDVLIRKARMEGKEACWVPGTDHASIATEAKVVAMLREKGIKKSDLTREEFLKYAWEWKEKYGGIILEQLKKLGASCDWDRTTFTMDTAYYEAVIDVFVDLYNKGYIYRGLRMVNWDPLGKTALSDDEVNYKDVQSKLYYIQYAIEGASNEFVTIATVRPETIMADTAICINPNDERYKHLKGKRAIIPLINRSIPIIEDEYVTMDFGTGCLKVTPAHDLNDYELGKKHNLEVIDILNEDGSLNEKAQILIGDDRFVARKKIAKLLEEGNHLARVEDYKSNVGFSERTDAVIEPRLSLQWFLKMDTITKPALEHVMNDDIKLIPPKFKNTYHHWMANVRDWCISRQLWWGHRIPAWYNEQGEFVVAKTEAEAIEKFKSENKPFTSVKQDEDVMDTWFSSWIWPIAVFDTSVFKDSSNKGNKDLNYYYPTNDLVTAPEILFFWVARMIIAGYEYRQEMPFKNVYLTGIVRDKQGRKMSKSLGNSPDPLDLIANFGADAVRTGMLFSSPAGNDLLYDEKLVEQGRNFANKIWNAFRLVKGWTVSDEPTPAENKIAIEWFEARVNQGLTELNDHFEKFRMSDALMTIYKLIWDDFCSWYLEMVKPEFGKPIDQTTYTNTVSFFETLLKALHPFMPFITEELWHELKDRDTQDCILVASWPKVQSFNISIIEKSGIAQEIITQVRNARSSKGLSPKEPLKLNMDPGVDAGLKNFQPVIEKLGNLSEVRITKDKEGSGTSFLVGSLEFFIPFDTAIDPEKEKASLLKDLEYQRGFLNSVSKKLENERFVNSAPAHVLEMERKKKADAEAKIKALEESLARL